MVRKITTILIYFSRQDLFAPLYRIDISLYSFETLHQGQFTIPCAVLWKLLCPLWPHLEYAFVVFFLNLLLATDKLKFDLPNSWLSDMIDEFVYQFEGFCHYRMKLREKKEKSDIEFLKAHQNVWNTATVLNYLEQFVSKSNMNATLQSNPESLASENSNKSTPTHTLEVLGYFSLIGLSRVHCLLGDYHNALDVLANLNIFGSKKLFARFPVCCVVTFYVVGFSYLMSKRYLDAIKCFTTVLGYVARTKQISMHPSKETVCFKWILQLLDFETCWKMLRIARHFH